MNPEIARRPVAQRLREWLIARCLAPINLDGSQVSDVTIDGQSVSAVTMDGDQVFGGAIPDSAVSRWTFDNADTESGTAFDSWGNNDGTVNGATTGVSGANKTYTTNEAYDFSGSDYVETPIASIQAPFSFACWIYPTNIDSSDNTHQTIFSNFDGGNADFSFAHSNNYDGNLYVLGDYVSYTGEATTKISTNTWYHACFTIGSSATVIYLDASQIATGGGSTSLISSSNNFRIGIRTTGNDGFLGSIDDPRYYSKKLSSTEVSNLYNNGSI